jgi:hypothetical protein
MRALLVLAAALLGVLLSWGAAAPATPQGQTVDTGKAAPPLGARNLGPIDASHGSGCGIFAVRGSYEGALAQLRNRAGEIGGNYVQIESVTEPHDDAGCTTGSFAIRGVVFFVSHGPVQAEQPAEQPAPPTGACDPPCSPGFACKGGACTPVCNPACEAGEVCTRRRTCEPAAPAVIVDAGAG